MSRYLLSLLCLLSFSAYGQYNETIRAGRPGDAMGAFVVGTKVFQVETGLQHVFTKLDGVVIGGNTETVDRSNSTALRFGLSEAFEINGVVGISSNETIDGANRNNGLSGLALGARYNLLDPAAGAPLALGIQSRVLLNTLIDEQFQVPDQRLGANVRASAIYGGLDFVGIAANLAAQWNGDDAGANLLYDLVFSRGIVGDLSGFVEVFGRLNNSPDANFDFGLAYLLSDDVQLDASAGFTGNDIQSWFFDFGVSFRFDPQD